MTLNFKKRYLTVFRFLLLAGWMGLIFYFSAQNSEISSGQSMSIGGILEKWLKIPVETLETVIRKLAHFSIYLVLGALASNSVGRLKGAKWYIVLAFCVVYSFSDEFHQTFISGRSGELRDVFIDSCGSGLGIYVFWLFFRKRHCCGAFGEKRDKCSERG